MPTIKVRDLDLYYQEHGRPDGEPLVLLHGFTSTGQAFDPFLDRLAHTFVAFHPERCTCFFWLWSSLGSCTA
jgi:pimeloyl-ACP methyl ester carboxylesterase